MLYPILDVEAVERRGFAPLDVLDVWLDAGIRLIQLRAKRLDSEAFLTLADAVAARAHAASAQVLINDRADIAQLSRADGVHVGQDDLPVTDVRAIVGLEAIVGISTHSLAQVQVALDQPADYIAIGPVYETASKGRAADPVIGLAGVRAASAACRSASRPLVAIGGITVETLDAVLDAGADMVAVISDLLIGQPGERVRVYLDAIARRAV